MAWRTLILFLAALLAANPGASADAYAGTWVPRTSSPKMISQIKITPPEAGGLRFLHLTGICIRPNLTVTYCDWGRWPWQVGRELLLWDTQFNTPSGMVPCAGLRFFLQMAGPGDLRVISGTSVYPNPPITCRIQGIDAPQLMPPPVTGMRRLPVLEQPVKPPAPWRPMQ